MADFDPTLVAEIVRRVITELNHSTGAAAGTTGVTNGIFATVDQAFAAAEKAQKIWHAMPRADKAKVIAALRQTMHDHAEEFARRAQQETGMGRVEDKIAKHHNAADATPGLEDLEVRSWSGDKGLVVEEYAPYGVIAAITPSTHPIPVLLNSSIIMIAPGNAVIFNVHPAAKNVSAYAMEIFNRTIVDNGGPANLISMLREPTMEGANELFHHPQIRLIAATGGPGLVKAAFAAGKKVVAAGPGNPPVVVDVTADLDRAAREIIKGASFDNNILCIAEKEVFVVDGVFDRFMQAMANAGAVRLNAAQIEMLTAKAFGKNDKGQVFVSRDLIGKNANVLAAIAGLTLPDQVRILYGETDKNHLFVQEEQMMPFLPIVRCPSVEKAIEWSVEAEHGFGHTAMIYSNHLETITRFTRAIDTDIVVVNGPSGAGNGGYSGEGYFSHTIASPTGEGICTPRDFARVRRLAIYENLQVV
ncbi:MAG TPA: aldehyde dehydrogenase EutE [bacterium]|jgi:acyl-CoA reductase-like NAD-dependent aldehyde dehydrogenase|nr:aldehyde dehydrogenase EutE [bacterium]